MDVRYIVSVLEEGNESEGNERLTKVDQKVAPSPPLPNRQRHDTTNIVGRAPLFLGKVPDKLCPERARLGHDVEQERLDVVVERLVVEELLREEAQVLAIDLHARSARSGEQGQGVADGSVRSVSLGFLVREGREETPRTLAFRPSTSNTETLPSR